MPYRRSTDEEKSLAALSKATSELHSQEGSVRREAPTPLPQPAPPEQPSPAPMPEKAMAASAPGSEYWLP
jgi:hypothetical protein